MEQKQVSIWQATLVKAAIGGSFRRLDPRLLWHNPVMFVVEVGFRDYDGDSDQQSAVGRTVRV